MSLADLLGSHLDGGVTPSVAIRRDMAQQVRQFLSATWDAAGIPGGALGLVGSFATAEGGPRSDLDVTILLPADGNPAAHTSIEPIVRLLWDSGLHVDHSVRTTREAAAVSRDDLPALTGLLGLQHVAGDATLTEEVSRLVRDRFRTRAQRRVGELLDDATSRWERYDRLDCLNEPDLKNSMGGLRDVVLLRALSTAWLSDYPHRSVDRAVSTILDVRDALHQVTGRHTSVLLRALQPEVAQMLGYASETEMMRRLQAAGTAVAEASRTTMESARQNQNAWGASALARRVLRPRAPRGPRAIPSGAELVGQGLLLAQGRVGFARPDDAANPDRVLEAAVYSAEEAVPISRSTLIDMGQAARIPFEWTEGRLDAFLRLLGAGAGLREAWASLESVGVVTQWLPEWEPLRGRPQTAQFHHWTVGRHLIETVIHTRDILAGTERGTSLDLGSPVSRRAVLLAALLHDLGKQPPDGGTGHPEHGRRLAEPLLRRLPLDTAEQRTILFLIENHLLLAQSAIDRNPTEPENIAHLLDRCNHSRELLDSLAALTCADSLGAGPKAWTPWRESLIASCLEAARAELRGR